MEFDRLTALKRNHPAWRLLGADNGPMIASFLHSSFIVPNIRTFARQQLASQLDDHLFHLHANAGEVLFPKAKSRYRLSRRLGYRRSRLVAQVLSRRPGRAAL